ncbi:hypothetical protein [Bacillus sp. BP-3]|uniref:hypothetical protein n=1 Tax=Bacillus sp. BP-3 TaxID=3022773 RepID=UPI00232DC021|nr:hypothetical protein [Bacillus sp. BP-3]MDC2863878.1 hypothetical protein [Bacillus sp. BP-3]
MDSNTVTSLQLMQQLQQAEAAAGNRLILKKVNTTFDAIFIMSAILTGILTLGLSLILFAIIYVIKEALTKTCLVKNVATGEKFRVDKNEFKQYKKSFKSKEKEVRKISDL